MMIRYYLAAAGIVALSGTQLSTAAFGDEQTIEVVSPTVDVVSPAGGAKSGVSPIVYKDSELQLPWPDSMDLEALAAVDENQFVLWENLTVECMARAGFQYVADPPQIILPGHSPDEVREPEPGRQNREIHARLDADGRRAYSTALAGVDDVYSESSRVVDGAEGGCIASSRRVYPGLYLRGGPLIDEAIAAFVGPQNDCLADDAAKRDLDAANDPNGQPEAPAADCNASDETRDARIAEFTRANDARLSKLRSDLVADFEAARQILSRPGG